MSHRYYPPRRSEEVELTWEELQFINRLMMREGTQQGISRSLSESIGAKIQEAIRRLTP